MGNIRCAVEIVGALPKCAPFLLSVDYGSGRSMCRPWLNGLVIPIRPYEITNPIS